MRSLLLRWKLNWRLIALVLLLLLNRLLGLLLELLLLSLTGCSIRFHAGILQDGEGSGLFDQPLTQWCCHRKDGDYGTANSNPSLNYVNGIIALCDYTSLVGGIGTSSFCGLHRCRVKSWLLMYSLFGGWY